MHNWIRYYYKNRLKIWAIILGIIFVIVLIQIFNSFSKNKRQAEAKEIEEKQHENVVSYNEESKSITTGESVNKNYQDQFGTLLDSFLTACIEHKLEKAYTYLSTEIKDLMYQTETIFEESYYKGKFEGNKQYSFQSWSANGNEYVYLVKIFDNMLATGTSSETNFIEDYITIVPEEDTFKVNVNGFITRKDEYKENESNSIFAEVSTVDIYIEKQIYTLNLKNKTNERIMLDTRKSTKTTYLTDVNNVKTYALLYENKEEDLILEPQESKTIQIKFNETYRNDLPIKEITFSNIVKESKLNNSESLTIEL